MTKSQIQAELSEIRERMKETPIGSELSEQEQEAALERLLEDRRRTLTPEASDE